MRELDDITEAIVDAAIQIHRDLGPGLLESVYEAVLGRKGLRRIVNDFPPSASPRLRVNQSTPNRLREGLTEQHCS
jgi:iron complex transport system substrate-binding protein